MTATSESSDNNQRPGATPDGQGGDRFVIDRRVDASPARVYAMWTSSEHLARWLAPPGFTLHYLRAAIEPGGSTLFSLTGLGMTMYGRTAYEELRPAERVAYTQQFCDEHENVTRHPLAPTWPETLRVTVELREESAERTHMQLTMSVAGDATPGEAASFAAGVGSMTMGWTVAFNQLDAALASA